MGMPLSYSAGGGLGSLLFEMQELNPYSAFVHPNPYVTQQCACSQSPGESSAMKWQKRCFSVLAKLHKPLGPF